MNKYYYLFVCSFFLFLSCKHKNSINTEEIIDTDRMTILSVSLKLDPKIVCDKTIGGFVFVFNGEDENAKLNGRICFSCSDSNPAPINVPITAGTRRQVYVVANIILEDFFTAITIKDFYGILDHINYTSNAPYCGYMMNVNTLNSTSDSPTNITINLEANNNVCQLFKNKLVNE